MHDYWEKAREHARVAMGDLIKQAVDDNMDDMLRAYAYADKNAETHMERAKAECYFVTWCQAFHETEMAKLAAKPAAVAK